MVIFQIMIGLFVAIGVAFIWADVVKLPTMKASKAANNLGKKGNKKTSTLDIYLKNISAKLAEKIKLNEYKKDQLATDLKTAGLNITPEAYVSDAIVKSVAIGLLAIPAFFIVKILGLFIIFVAVVMYFSEMKKVSKMIIKKKQKIEYELPRMVSSIEKTASSELYPLLKREDEKFVTEQAYNNPKFVEDVLRDVVLLLRNDDKIDSFEVECESLESIHNHSAWAYQIEN